MGGGGGERARGSRKTPARAHPQLRQQQPAKHAHPSARAAEGSALWASSRSTMSPSSPARSKATQQKGKPRHPRSLGSPCRGRAPACDTIATRRRHASGVTAAVGNMILAWHKQPTRRAWDGLTGSPAREDKQLLTPDSNCDPDRDRARTYVQLPSTAGWPRRWTVRKTQKHGRGTSASRNPTHSASDERTRWPPTRRRAHTPTTTSPMVDGAVQIRRGKARFTPTKALSGTLALFTATYPCHVGVGAPG